MEYILRIGYCREDNPLNLKSFVASSIKPHEKPANHCEMIPGNISDADVPSYSYYRGLKWASKKYRGLDMVLLSLMDFSEDRTYYYEQFVEHLSELKKNSIYVIAERDDNPHQLVELSYDYMTKYYLCRGWHSVPCIRCKRGEMVVVKGKEPRPYIRCSRYPTCKKRISVPKMRSKRCFR